MGNSQSTSTETDEVAGRKATDEETSTTARSMDFSVDMVCSNTNIDVEPPVLRHTTAIASSIEQSLRVDFSDNKQTQARLFSIGEKKFKQIERSSENVVDETTVCCLFWKCHLRKHISTLQNTIAVKDYVIYQLRTQKVELERQNEIFTNRPPSDAEKHSRTRGNVDTHHQYTQNGTDENQYITETADLNDRLNESKHAIENLQDKLETNKVEIASLDDQNKTLSSSASDKLRDNKPTIVDLNNDNRPQKIADRLSELYSNEWTNAFAALQNTGKSEKDIVKILFKLIKMAYEKCEEKSAEQMQTLKISVSDFIGDKEIPERMTSSLKTFKDERKRNYQIVLPSILEMVYDTNLHKKYCHENDVQSYMNSAIELCWLMCIQDPPLVLELNGKRNDDFNDQLYRPYTKHSKTVSFYVWPVLYLHENGPLMCKGVAQGKTAKNTQRMSRSMQNIQAHAWDAIEGLQENSDVDNSTLGKRISRELSEKQRTPLHIFASTGGATSILISTTDTFTTNTE